MSGDSEKASPLLKTWKVRAESVVSISQSGGTNSACRPNADTTVVTAYKMHESGFFRKASTLGWLNQALASTNKF